MAVTDPMVIILLLCTVNYLLLWRHEWVKRMLADLIFIFIGIASHYVVSITEYPWGFLLAIIAIIDLIYQILNP